MLSMIAIYQYLRKMATELHFRKFWGNLLIDVLRGVTWKLETDMRVKHFSPLRWKIWPFSAIKKLISADFLISFFRKVLFVMPFTCNFFQCCFKKVVFSFPLRQYCGGPFSNTCETPRSLIDFFCCHKNEMPIIINKLRSKIKNSLTNLKYLRNQDEVLCFNFLWIHQKDLAKD